jgi:Zn-dependent membrane protease YugP
MGFLFFDWTWLLLIPGIILSIFAQAYVSKTYSQYQKIRAASGVSGSRFAEVMLRQNGVSGVSVMSVKGNLTDHYNPKTRQVALSEGVFGAATVSAIAIAAHECGHVLQHTKGYAPMKVRTALVPVVNIVSSMCFPLLFIGIIFAYTPFVAIAAWAYLGICVFQLVTLPVEFNASKRAIQNISASGVLTAEELPGAKKVLRAAALTYVAALLVSLLQFLRLMALSRRR